MLACSAACAAAAHGVPHPGQPRPYSPEAPLPRCALWDSRSDSVPTSAYLGSALCLRTDTLRAFGHAAPRCVTTPGAPAGGSCLSVGSLLHCHHVQLGIVAGLPKRWVKYCELRQYICSRVSLAKVAHAGWKTAGIDACSSQYDDGCCARQWLGKCWARCACFCLQATTDRVL